MHKDYLCELIDSSSGDQSNYMLIEAIDKVKLNTRRLVRRQRRKLNQLQMLFWMEDTFLRDYARVLMEVTCFIDSLDASWAVNVVEPSVKIIEYFLENIVSSDDVGQACEGTIDLPQRDLWT